MQIAGYQIRGELARGGMGVVYRALSPGLGRQVALKLLKAEGVLSAAQQERFLREGQITARLEHPGIVRVHASGVDDGRPYLVYELIEGAQTLGDAFRTSDFARRLELLEQAAEALGYAHQHGVTHRDVKPENILVDSSGAVKVADFGLASAPGLQRLTRTGAVLGTPQYMAPEQILAERGLLGPHTDVWALGVILYQALTGDLPFSGESVVALSAQIAAGPSPALRRRVNSISPALGAVCLAALRPDPGERYPNGEAFASELALVRKGASPKALVVSRRKRQQRRTWLSLGLAAVFVVVFNLLPAPDSVRDPALDPPLAPRPSATPDPSPVVSEAAPASAPLAAGLLLRLTLGEGEAGALFVGPRRFLAWSGSTLELWELSEQGDAAETLQAWSAPLGGVASVIPDPLGGYLAAMGDRFFQLRLDQPGLEPVRRLPERGRGEIAVSPDGLLLAAAGGGKAWLFDRTTGTVLRSWGPYQSPIRQLTFLGPGTLAWITGGPQLDGGVNRIYIWDGAQPDRDPVCGQLMGMSLAFVYLSQRSLLAVGSSSRLSLLSLSPEIRAVGGFQGEGIEVDPLIDALGGPSLSRGAVRTIWLSAAEDRLLALASIKTSFSELRCWDPNTEEQAGEPLQLEEYLRSFTVSPDERLLIACDALGTLQVWNAEELLHR